MTIELAGETRSDARLASERVSPAIVGALQRMRGTGPRTTKKRFLGP